MIQTARQNSDSSYGLPIPAMPTGSAPGTAMVQSSRLLAEGLMANMTSSASQLLFERREWVVPQRASARSLLKYAGTWAGNDLEERLAEVYATRGEAEF